AGADADVATNGPTGLRAGTAPPSRSSLLPRFPAGLSSCLVSATIVSGARATGPVGRLWLPLAKCRYASPPAPRTTKTLTRRHCGRARFVGGTIFVVLDLVLCFMA